VNDEQEKIHHAIVELYEVEDADAVRIVDVCNHTGMSLFVVSKAMSDLEDMGLVGLVHGVVTMVKNNGYYPTEYIEQS